jgi:hypothetical protein
MTFFDFAIFFSLVKNMRECKDMTNSSKQPTLLSDILSRYEPKKDGKYISQEFQDYAYRLAVDLDDLAHKSLYMRLAKSTPRGLLDTARAFALDAPNARSKARIFMWKLRELRASVKLAHGI